MPNRQIIKLLEDMLRTFEKDPPDSPFQEGYKAALLEVKRCVLASDGSAGQLEPKP